MLKLTTKVLAPLAAVVGLSGMAFEAQATPAFARQMDMNCFACHNQSVPMLNSFGRAFKLSGYTMTSGNKSMITGGDLGLSLPTAINAGVGFKSNYLKTDDTNARGELRLPTGAAIMLGGKVAGNMGAHTLWNGDGLIHTQLSYSRPIAAGNAGMVMYGSKGHGAFIGTESYNTGLHKELAMFDNSGRTNAVQAMGIGLGKGPTSGLSAFYGGNNGLKVAAGIRNLGFNTTYDNGGSDVHGTYGTLYRISYDAPAIASWNVSIGAFGIGGTTTGTASKVLEGINTPFMAAPWYNAKNVYDFDITSNGLDLQAQGKIAGMDTMVLLTSVSGYEFAMTAQDMGQPFYGVERKLADTKANSLEMQIMPTSAWGIRAGMMNYSDNATSTKDYSTMSFGVNYNYADNVRFSVENTSIDRDTGTDFSETMLTALVAF